MIVNAVARVGPKWAYIASLLADRTDDAVRNRYLRLQKKTLASSRPLPDARAARSAAESTRAATALVQDDPIGVAALGANGGNGGEGESACEDAPVNTQGWLAGNLSTTAHTMTENDLMSIRKRGDMWTAEEACLTRTPRTPLLPPAPKPPPTPCPSPSQLTPSLAD